LQYAKCWNEKNVDLYFTTESREKNKEVFEKTHLPIQKIRVDFSKDLPVNKDFINEGEFKNLVVKSLPEDHNRIFLIVGETGCGKSELCQWLEYNIDDGLHIPLHISRSDTKIEDIARILNSHLPEPPRESEESVELVNIAPELLAEKLTVELKIEFGRDKTIKNPRDRNILEKLFKDAEFRIKLARDIENYQQGILNRNKERRLLILSEQSFKWFPIANGLADVEKSYLFVNKVITNTLKEYLKVTDLGNKLKQISEHYAKQGKRPVLLLEDLTSFTFLAEDLIDYLFDLPKGHYDVVIGWTTGFESAHRDFIFKAPDALTYMKERLRARLVLTDENGSTFFLKDAYKELARKYLSAIKCGRCRICKTDKDGLYPFNAPCLDKIYGNLQEEGHPKQTPRLFLEFVIRRILQSPELPWKVLSSTSLYIRPVPSLIGQAYNDFPDFVELAKWYGAEKERNVEIETAVIEWFGIPSPFPKEGQKCIIPMSSLGIAIKKGGIRTEEEVQMTNEEEVADFQLWLEGKSTRFLGRDSLRKGAIEEIQLVADPCEIKNARSTLPKTVSLFYQRGVESIPVFVEDSGDDPIDKEYKLVVPRKSPPEVLEQLFYVGRGGTVSESNVVAVLEWGNEQAEEFNKRLVRNLADAMGIRVEELVIFSKFLIVNLVGECRELDANHLKTDIEQNHSPTPFFLDDNLNVNALALLEKADEIQSLFSSFFLITSTFFDYLTFQEFSSSIDLNKILKKVGNIDLRRIRDGYKTGSKKENKPFREFIGAVRNYAQSLGQFPYEEHYDRIKEIMAKVENLIPDERSETELPQKIENIKKACAMLDIALEQSWIESFQAILTQSIDFRALQNAIHNVMTDFPECENVFQFVQFMQRYGDCSRKNEWKLISILATIAQVVRERAEDYTSETNGQSSLSLDTKRVEASYEELSRLTTEFT
jgi:hypothetical protein